MHTIYPLLILIYNISIENLTELFVKSNNLRASLLDSNSNPNLFFKSSHKSKYEFLSVSAWELRGAATAAAAATGQGAHISCDNDNENDSSESESESPGSGSGCAAPRRGIENPLGGWDGHLLCFDLVA